LASATQGLCYFSQSPKNKYMTVLELISELSNYSPDLNVVYRPTGQVPGMTVSLEIKRVEVVRVGRRTVAVVLTNEAQELY
jgi:hypothetical protein